MKVKELLEHLAKLDPEAHVCALVYDKSQFEFPEEDELMLTDEGWESLCKDFDGQLWQDVWFSLQDGAIYYASNRVD